MEHHDGDFGAGDSAVQRKLKRSQDESDETFHSTSETEIGSEDSSRLSRRTKPHLSPRIEMKNISFSVKRRVDFLFATDIELRSSALQSRHAFAEFSKLRCAVLKDAECNCDTCNKTLPLRHSVKDTCGCHVFGAEASSSRWKCPLREALNIVHELLHYLHTESARPDQDLTTRDRIEQYKRLVMQKYSVSLTSEYEHAFTLAKQQGHPNYCQKEVTVDFGGVLSLTYTTLPPVTLEAGGHSWYVYIF